MSKLRIGIIGSGFGLYGLLPAFNSLKNAQVVAITGKRTERLENYCKSIGLKNIYSSFEEMFKGEKLDAIAVAVVPNAQYKIVKLAIKKGLHVFAEKPLAANLKQASELYKLSQKNKTITAVDFIFPEIPEWVKVKEILNSARYGKLEHISSAWDFLSYDIKNKIRSWKTDSKQGGGALSFYFSHNLYALEYFAGEIGDLKSQLSYSKESLNGGETGVDVILKFRNGIYGDAHVSCNANVQNTHKLIFVCEKANMILENINGSNTNFSIKVESGKSAKEIKLKKTKSVKDQDERVFVVRNLASRFVNGVLNKKPITPSFKEGLRVQQIIEKIRQKQLATLT